MKKVIKQWLAFSLAIGALVSCGEDRNEPSSTAEGSGEAVTLSLSAEVSVDDADLRAIYYKLGTNAKGQLVPLPEFTDGQEVDVHTVIKSTTGTLVAQTLKWRYNAASKKLVLRTNDGNSLYVSNFHNDNGAKWYISGLIGGTFYPATNVVRFNGMKRFVRELKGVEGNVGEIVGNLDVPYAFPWTELVIDTSNKANTKTAYTNSYKFAQVPTSANVKFQPMGSLIAYKIGTNQKSGAHTFTPKGIMVYTNAFGDQGVFDLNADLPTDSTPTVLPKWKEENALKDDPLFYSFASGQEPGTIAHQQTADKVYYAWVMPRTTQPDVVSTHVYLQGESSRPATSTYSDYTKTWFTDYQVKASRLAQGRVHMLKANATQPMLLPIQYVTDYNLAGGEGLTSTVSAGSTKGYLDHSDIGGIQPEGIRGQLRFATSHANDKSGYYNGYKVLGKYDATYNPETKSLQAEVDNTFGAGVYDIPEVERWWGVFPSNFYIYFSETNKGISKQEPMAFDNGREYLRQNYVSTYSKSVTESQNTVIYAIRFMEYHVSKSLSLDGQTVEFPKAADDLFRCAYRFTRVGGTNSWGLASKDLGQNLSNQLIIDVVYLGEEVSATSLETISNAQWWNDKESQGLVISKTFPATGVIDYTGIYETLDDRNSNGRLSRRGGRVAYWARTSSSNSIYYMQIHDAKMASNEVTVPKTSHSVRLFYKKL